MAAQQPVLWKKRVLVPFWVVRICLMIFIIGIYALALSNLNEIKDIIKPAMATRVIFMLFIVIVLLLDILAIVLFLRDALKPGTFLTMNVFQTSFWAGVLIMDFVAIGKGASAVGIGFSIFVFLSFVGLLIYSIVGYNRAKKAARRGEYAAAHNPAWPVQGSHATQDYASHSQQQNTAYYPPAGTNHELQTSPYLPPYQGGASTDYYHQQPAKPAHMV